MYWPPVSVHCYQLSGEEDAQVRADRKRSGADKEVWGGWSRQRLEGRVADWQKVELGIWDYPDIVEQTSSQCSKSKWEMELCADDETCQSYGKVIIKVMGERELVRGCKRDMKCSRVNKFIWKAAYLVGKESSWKQRRGSGIYKVIDILEDG